MPKSISEQHGALPVEQPVNDVRHVSNLSLSSFSFLGPTPPLLNSCDRVIDSRTEDSTRLKMFLKSEKHHAVSHMM